MKPTLFLDQTEKSTKLKRGDVFVFDLPSRTFYICRQRTRLFIRRDKRGVLSDDKQISGIQDPEIARFVAEIIATLNGFNCKRLESGSNFLARFKIF
ncbi:MAG TPA: hypothetical protein VJB92_01885 [Candidatus Paceibacterota bacterium]